MSEKMPSSIPSEEDEITAAEQSETQDDEQEEKKKRGLGKAVMSFVSKVRRHFGGAEESFDNWAKRAEQREIDDLDKNIDVMTANLEAEVARIRESGSDNTQSVVYISTRLAEKQAERINKGLPVPIQVIAKYQLDPNRHEDMIAGAYDGEPDKGLPALVKIAQGGATAEDLRKALEVDAESDEITPEHISKMRRYLRMEPFAKALSGDYSDFSSIGDVTGRNWMASPDARVKTYLESYREKLQSRLDEGGVSELERQAIEAEIAMLDENLQEMGRKREAKQSREEESEQPRQELAQVEALKGSELAEPVYDSIADSRLQKKIEADMQEQMSSAVSDETMIEAEEMILSHYERIIPKLEAEIAEKGDQATPEEKEELEKRKDARARNQIEYISRFLPTEMRDTFREQADFDEDPSKREERFVLPILVSAARGELDLDALDAYLDEHVGDMPKEKRDKILQSYRDFLQAILDRK